ncbi:unnamed protein product [Blepharisma stoltei]|uniref:VWFA domain-containing protein n=1 Tax=Blepharisma stoltei TaxID=1481888 RepID=A0AAU9J0H2_9CILI|nr:unnamed protein product [Blepharisma stoltei]
MGNKGSNSSLSDIFSGYSDDENIEIIQEETKVSVAATSNPQRLQLSMKAALSYLQLNSSAAQELPCSFSMQALESSPTEGGVRQGIDIVCVIDVSGSMQGDKIELTKKTLEFMVGKLEPKDRMSLVLFSSEVRRILPLIKMTEVGKQRALSKIAEIHAGGGTELVEGLDHGLKVIEDRRIVNQITSIILLTDGQDNNGSTALDRAKLRVDSAKTKNYSIHTFGYGSDHDAKLLNAISEWRNGGFYYIEKNDSIPMAFSNCLGELMSTVADQIQVRFQTQAADIPFALTKVYSESGDSVFSMPPVLTGDKKEAIFVLNFPPCQQQVPEGHSISPVKGFITYKQIQTGETVEEECTINIPIFNESAQIDSIELDEDVMVNFYRVKAAAILKEAAEFGERSDMEGARNLLQRGADELRNSVVAGNEIVKLLISDLDGAKARFVDYQAYEYGGRAEIKSKARGHWNKRAQNAECYMNSCQKAMNFSSQEHFSKN